MNLPVIMAAFGTTAKATAAYSRLGNFLTGHFPQTEIIWTCTSKKIGNLSGEQTNLLPMDAVLTQLIARGVARVIVQSLHLFPGTEFHGLVKSTANGGLQCALGMPVLTSPRDYDEAAEILRPVIAARPDHAILVLGHGTDHPIWTAYYCLEKILRKKFGPQVFVGVVEKQPDTSGLVDEIVARGFTRVCIIPFFLVAGMHYRRDIVSDSPESWRSRFEHQGVEVEAIGYGLGMYEGFEKIVVRHIIEASRTMA